MKLYAFDSCPYCVRVRALIGLKNIDCDTEYLVAGCLPDVLADKVNTFTVPMLELSTTTAEDLIIMQESGDIIRYLDGLDGQPLFDRYQISEGLQAWLDRAKPALEPLCYPRMPKLGLPELGSSEAMQFFECSRKQKLGMSLPQMLEKTAGFMRQLEPELVNVTRLLDINGYLSDSRPINIDDLYAFAELRNLSMVQELRIPGELAEYIGRISDLTQVPLYVAVNRFDFDREQASV